MRIDHSVPVQDAAAAFGAVQDLNHAILLRCIPAPTAYDVLGNLKLLGPALAQALAQLGDGLAASLDAYDVYEDDGRDPRTSIRMARDALAGAADHAHSLGDLLESAQCAISRQGYRVPVTDTGTDNQDNRENGAQQA